jgi:hypothetical protein
MSKTRQTASGKARAYVVIELSAKKQFPAIDPVLLSLMKKAVIK